MQDTIERQVAIKASIERVYTAIADPEQIVSWFPDAIQGKFEVGEQPIFDFGEDGKNRVYIESAQPYDYFAFRWAPGTNHAVENVLDNPNTLVEFRLKESDGATVVTMKESGFATLPPETAVKQLQDNTGGWNYMMGRLEKKFAQE